MQANIREEHITSTQTITSILITGTRNSSKISHMRMSSKKLLTSTKKWLLGNESLNNIVESYPKNLIASRLYMSTRSEVPEAYFPAFGVCLKIGWKIHGRMCKVL
jgi:hypothetical protein